MADRKRKQQRKANRGPSVNTVKAREADARARQAEAEAQRAVTEAKRLEIEAAERAAQRAEKRRAEDKAPSEQLRQVGLVAGPLVAGMAYGKHKADKIQVQAEKAARAKNKQLDKVAAKLRGVRDPARLAAAVKVADGLKLSKMKGPVGAVTAGFLVTEAVAARVVAANTDNETAREVLNGAALGLGAAAVGTVGTRLVQRATSSVLPNAAALVDIETARETLNKTAPKQANAAPTGGTALAKATKVALPVLAGIAAVSAFNDAAKAGESTAEATKKGAKAAGDVVSFGAVSAHDRAKGRGASDVEAVAVGTAVGAINFATFGVAEMANDALSDKGGVSGVISDTVTTAAAKVSELLGWAGTATPPAATDSSGEAAANASPGLAQRVAQEAFRPNSLVSAGVAAVATRSFPGAVLTYLATKAVLDAVSPDKPAQPKAYLNAQAAQKAGEPSRPVSAPPTVAAAAQQHRSDGQTEGYTRRTKTGLTVQVQGYRTPTRR